MTCWLNKPAKTRAEIDYPTGLLKLASTCYLVSVSSREQVAQIRGKPIYVITDVALIPLSSQSEAQNAITHARNALNKGKTEPLHLGDTDDEDESDGGGSTIAEEDEENDSIPSTPITETPSSKTGTLKHSTTVVSDVIQNKGSYGRFAGKWFSKAGWKDEGRRKQGMSSEENLSITPEQKKSAEDALPDSKKHEAAHSPAEHASKPADTTADEVDTQKPSPSSLDTVVNNLTPRILSTTKLFFASRSFFFSYDYDISRSLSRQEPNPSGVPLHRRFDPLVCFHKGIPTASPSD